jgi:hypothetical protein
MTNIPNNRNGIFRIFAVGAPSKSKHGKPSTPAESLGCTQINQKEARTTPTLNEMRVVGGRVRSTPRR